MIAWCPRCTGTCVCFGEKSPSDIMDDINRALGQEFTTTTATTSAADYIEAPTKSTHSIGLGIMAAGLAASAGRRYMDALAYRRPAPKRKPTKDDVKRSRKRKLQKQARRRNRGNR